MGVIWKPIPEDPRYSANEEGYIKNNTTGRITKGYKKRSKVNTYYYVKLGKYGKERQVHQLVLEAFGFPKPSDKYEVDHINADTSDNRLSNIHWVTSSENNLNPIWIAKKSKPIVQYLKEDVKHPIAWWSSIKECELFTKIQRNSIIKVCKGKQHSTSGFTFKYMSYE